MALGRHWTPRYAVDRVRWEIFQRRNGDKPWLTPASISMLETLLRPTDIGIEWGSGRSTLWFARRLKHLTSVEDNSQWSQQVRATLVENNVQNVTYEFLSADAGKDSPYVRICDRLPDRSLGFALIDGSAREHCASAVLPKLAPGAVLVIDNINWFLDHRSRSPSSRCGKGPANKDWEEFAGRVADWRMAWTSSGVTDTAIWVSPCSL